MEEFYMVYVEGTQPPKLKHKTQEAAVEEATRLAETLAPRKCFVLKAIAQVVISAPVVVTYADDVRQRVHCKPAMNDGCMRG